MLQHSSSGPQSLLLRHPRQAPFRQKGVLPPHAWALAPTPQTQSRSSQVSALGPQVWLQASHCCPAPPPVAVHALLQQSWLPGLAGHRIPLAPSLFGCLGFTPQLAVDVEHRVAADHDAVGADFCVQLANHCLGFRLGQCGDHGGGVGAVAQFRDCGVLVDAGDDDQRVDSGAAQHAKPAGRCRTQNDPGHGPVIGCLGRSPVIIGGGASAPSA